MPKLFDNADSGNGYKIRLILALCGMTYERVEVDTYAGMSRTSDFLARNPNGKIPLLQLDDGSFLSESGAIMFHIAKGTAFWPATHRDQSIVLQWMFFEQYSHEPYVAVLRSWSRHGPMTEERRSQWETKKSEGYRALGILEDRLIDRNWIVGDGPTIADIALYAYTHVADQGGFELDRYPAIGGWIERMQALPGYIAFDDLGQEE